MVYFCIFSFLYPSVDVYNERLTPSGLERVNMPKSMTTAASFTQSLSDCWEGRGKYLWGVRR